MESVTPHNLEDFYAWMVVDAQRAPTTARVRRRIVARTLNALGTPSPEPAQVEREKRTMMLAGRSADHARNFVKAWRDYYTFLGRPEAAKAIVMPKKGPRKMPRYLTVEEVSQFMETVWDTRDRALFALLAYSGLRVHEVLKLRPTDVDITARSITILGKGGKSAVIPFGAPAVPLLEEYLRERDTKAPTLFYARNDGLGGEPTLSPMSDVRVRVLARKYGKRAGIRHVVTPHQFRHGLFTAMVENGCPLPVVQVQARHSRVETTMLYVHMSAKAQRTNFDRFLPNYMEGSAQGS